MLSAKQIRRSLVKNADKHVVGNSIAEQEEHINREVDLVRLPYTESLLFYLNNVRLPPCLSDEDPIRWWHPLEQKYKVEMLLPEGALKHAEISFEFRDERPRIVVTKNKKYRSCYFVKVDDISDTPSTVKYLKQMGCVADMFPLENYDFLAIRLNNRLNPLIMIFDDVKRKELVKVACDACMLFVRDARKAIKKAEVGMADWLGTSKLPPQFIRMIAGGIQVSMFCGRYVKKDVSLRMSLDNHDISLSHDDGSDYKFPVSKISRVTTTLEWLNKMRDPRKVAEYENLGFLVPVKPIEDPSTPGSVGTPSGSVGSPSVSGYGSDSTMNPSPLPMRKKVCGEKKTPMFKLSAVADNPEAYQNSMQPREPSFFLPDNPVYAQMKKIELFNLQNVASIECHGLSFPVMLIFSDKELSKNFCYFVKTAQEIVGHPACIMELEPEPEPEEEEDED